MSQKRSEYDSPLPDRAPFKELQVTHDGKEQLRSEYDSPLPDRPPLQLKAPPASFNPALHPRSECDSPLPDRPLLQLKALPASFNPAADSQRDDKEQLRAKIKQQEGELTAIDEQRAQLDEKRAQLVRSIAQKQSALKQLDEAEVSASLAVLELSKPRPTYQSPPRPKTGSE